MIIKLKWYCGDLKECDFILSDRESVGIWYIVFLRCDLICSYMDYFFVVLIKNFVIY